MMTFVFAMYLGVTCLLLFLACLGNALTQKGMPMHRLIIGCSMWPIGISILIYKLAKDWDGTVAELEDELEK